MTSYFENFTFSYVYHKTTIAFIAPVITLQTKWTWCLRWIFCWQNFQMKFLLWKECFYLYSNFTGVCSWGSSLQWVGINSGNGLAPVGRFEPKLILFFDVISDNKVHGANMGPTWVLSAPGGPHVGPMNLAIRDILSGPQYVKSSQRYFSFLIT